MPGRATESTGLIIASAYRVLTSLTVYMYSPVQEVGGAVGAEPSQCSKRQQIKEVSVVSLCHGVGYYECDCCVYIDTIGRIEDSPEAGVEARKTYATWHR